MKPGGTACAEVLERQSVAWSTAERSSSRFSVKSQEERKEEQAAQVHVVQTDLLLTLVTTISSTLIPKYRLIVSSMLC